MSNNSNNQNSSGTNKKSVVNPLELLRDSGKGALDSVKKDLLKPLPEEIAAQIFGRAPRKFSGEIQPGEALEMKDVYSGNAQKNESLKKAFHLESRLLREEAELIERRTGELRVKIQAIHEEVAKAAKATVELSREVEIAAFQAPGSTSEYELYFLERIFEFIRSYRKKIQNARVWLATANRRAAKRNMWGQNYKSHGAKYLLSSEHYLQRSAG